MKISNIAKYIGATVVGASIAITVIHSHNDEPLSDINPVLSQADKDFDNTLSVQEWIPLLIECDKNKDRRFSSEEYEEAEKLLDGTSIESYHYNIRKTRNNFYTAREMMTQGPNSKEYLEWLGH